MLILAAAFASSVGVAMLVLRRSAHYLRWVLGALVVFVLVAMFIVWAIDAPSELDVARAYQRGTISYNEYRAGASRVDRAYDWAAAGGAVTALLIVGFAVFFERVRRSGGSRG